MRDLARQLSIAFRSLSRQPAVMVPAVLTLGLGIGANTALFAYLAAMLRPTVDAPRPERIVSVFSGTEQDRRMIFSHPELLDLQKRQTVVTDLFGTSRFGASVSDGQRDGRQSSFAWGGLVTGGYFSFFNARPVLGRLLQPADDRSGAPPVMVLSHRFWVGSLGGDPRVVGRELRVNGTGVTVVGVAAEGFEGMNYASAFYVPALLTDRLTATPRIENRDARWLGVFGRLAPGVSLDKAQAGLDVLARALDAAVPLPGGEARRMTAVPFGDGFDDESGDDELLDRARMLMGVASAFLLLGCISIANLLLARAISRQREWGIRASLGASRGWLLSGVLAESLVLCLLGGILGLGVAAILARRIEYFVMTAPSGLGDWSAGTKLVELDGRTAAFAALITVLCAFLGALGPVLRVMRGNLLGPLKSDASAGDSGRGSGGLAPRKILVVAQVALSVLLLLAGGLLARTLGQVWRVDPGFDPDGLLLVTVNIPRNVTAGEGGDGIYQRVLEEARRTPGVASASLSYTVPVTGWSREVQAASLDRVDEPIDVVFNTVSPKYFETMGIPILAGRALDERDREEPRTVVVSRKMAQRLWGEGPAVGRSLRIVDPAAPEVGERPFEVVGVARDIHTATLLEEPGPLVYFSSGQRKHPRMTLLVRSAASLAAMATLAPALRRSLQEAHPDLAIVDLVDCREHLARGLLEQRMYAEIAGLFALLGLGVAVLGLFGLLSYSVSLRGRELSIRMAVGARPRDVQRLVLRQGMALVAWGVIGGLAGALVLNRAMAGMLYGVEPTDPLTYVAVPAILALVSLIACYLPARRAARLDPTVALKGT